MKSAVVALSLVACLAGLAQANTVTYTTSTPISSTLTDWNGVLKFQQFDSSLGTLQSVTIHLSSTMSTVLTVTNSAASASQGSAKTEFQVSVQDSGNYLNVPEIDMFSSSFSYTLAANGTKTSGTLTKSASDEQTYTDAGVLAEFTGNGAINLSASSFTQTWLTNTGGNTFASQVTRGSLTGDVTYDYVPIPEPATMAMLAMGAGAAILRRRRK